MHEQGYTMKKIDVTWHLQTKVNLLKTDITSKIGKNILIDLKVSYTCTTIKLYTLSCTTLKLRQNKAIKR